MLNVKSTLNPALFREAFQYGLNIFNPIKMLTLHSKMLSVVVAEVLEALVNLDF